MLTCSTMYYVYFSILQYFFGHFVFATFILRARQYVFMEDISFLLKCLQDFFLFFFAVDCQYKQF